MHASLPVCRSVGRATRLRTNKRWAWVIEAWMDEEKSPNERRVHARTPLLCHFFFPPLQHIINKPALSQNIPTSVWSVSDFLCVCPLIFWQTGDKKKKNVVPIKSNGGLFGDDYRELAVIFFKQLFLVSIIYTDYEKSGLNASPRVCPCKTICSGVTLFTCPFVKGKHSQLMLNSLHFPPN